MPLHKCYIDRNKTPEELELKQPVDEIDYAQNVKEYSISLGISGFFVTLTAYI